MANEAGDCRYSSVDLARVTREENAVVGQTLSMSRLGRIAPS
jgi:hypothetical protein